MIAVAFVVASVLIPSPTMRPRHKMGLGRNSPRNGSILTCMSWSPQFVALQTLALGAVGAMPIRRVYVGKAEGGRMLGAARRGARWATRCKPPADNLTQV